MKKSNGKSKIIGILIIALSIGIFIVLRQRELDKTLDVDVEAWDNLYSGENIQFYYINKDVDKIVALKNTYEMESVIEGEGNDLSVVGQVDKWLGDKCGVSLDVMDSNKDAGEILSTLIKNSTISQKDYITVLQELSASLGVITRIGEYMVNDNYYILEVWNNDIEKWTAYDVIEGGYYKSGEKYLSGVELLNSDLGSVQISTLDGENKGLEKKRIKELKSLFGNYTVKIDNSKYEDNLINSCITYVKGEEDIELETEKGYIKPTIFVKSEEVFNINPHDKYKNDKSDEIPTIIFAKRNVKEDTNGNIKFTIGAFMNSSMLEDYYIKVNGSDFVKVNTYYELSLAKGENIVELSLDGSTTVRKVVISKN